MRKILLISLILTMACSCSREKQIDEMSMDQLRVFLRGTSKNAIESSDMKKGRRALAIQKSFPEGSTLIDLVMPEKIKLGKMSLLKAINQRRSRREYSDEALTNEELSFLLWSTQGISHMAKNESGGVDYHLRTVPSGGARHPFVTYLVISRVKDIAPGLYRFLPLQHKLLLIAENKNLSNDLKRACYSQPQAGNAAVSFIWTAIPYRTEWKYNFLSHKMIAVDAGHMCQNLYLAAESISAGACAMLGYDQKSMDSLLLVDGKDEFTVYMATVGKIKD